MLETFTKALFEKHEKGKFKLVKDPTLSLELELIEVSGQNRQPGAKRDPFSLVFRGPYEPLLEQRMYSILHETLGAFDLFLVPIGPDDKGMRYEAVFT